MGGPKLMSRSGQHGGVAVLVATFVILGVALVPLATVAGVPEGAGAATIATRAAAASSGTVWLCRPGQADDPCTSPLTSTAVTASGTTKVTTTAAAGSKKFDCFDVYPTVSGEPSENADLKVQPAEIDAAISQASRFSQVCDVWAPMYRQVTTAGLFKSIVPNSVPGQVAYDSLLSGWKDFLAHDDNGKPIIFIGHSQGSAILIQLLRSQIDPNPVLRKRMVSAIIAGGNLQVPVGRDVGATFHHIPLCTRAAQTGCVIAYSSFGSEPPATALFGRPGQGVSIQSDQTATTGQQVACVNPVTLSSASGELQPYFLSAGEPVPGVAVATPWVSFPGLYTATCRSEGGASWLQVTPTAVVGDQRPKVTAALGPLWGYHLADVNLALGNLVHDVALEEAAYH